MERNTPADGRAFWVAWGCGVVLLALLVWIGLRFWAEYSGCRGRDGCAGSAVKYAFFMAERGAAGQGDVEDRFSKLLIPPPSEEKVEIPDWLKKQEPPEQEPDGVRIDASPEAIESESQSGATGGEPLMTGPIDKEVIRRIIRRHLGTVKYCYEKALATNPELQGRVVVQFTIAATGQVENAQVQRSTLGHRGVERCVTTAVGRWLFPKPRGGGIAIISYPFVFRTTEEDHGSTSP
jgi:TonB family protein